MTVIDIGSRTVELYPGGDVFAERLFQPGDRIGDAIFVGYRKSDSPEWHEQRGTGYGGSDVATIVGVSKFKRRYTLWAERTGQVERVDDGKNNEAKEWGHLLEPVIARKFARDNPGLIVITAPEGWEMCWRNADRGMQLATPDGLYFDPTSAEWGILEIKTQRYDDDWKDDAYQPAIPTYYATQAQWYLEAFGLTVGIFAVLFTGSQFKTFPVVADPFEQRLNRAGVELFHQLVQTRTAPEFEGEDDVVLTVRRMNPDVNREQEADLGMIGTDWAASYAAITLAQETHKINSAKVIQAMGTAQKGLNHEGRVVVRRQSTKGAPAHLVVVK